MATKVNPDSVENVLKTGKEQFDAALKTGTQAAHKNFEQGVETAKKQLDELVKGYDELSAVGRENMDACIAASSAAVKAAETINGEVFALTKNAIDQSLAAFKSLAAAKSPMEFFDIQSNLMKSRYDETLAAANKINGLVTTVATDAMAPITTRITASVEKFSKSFA